MGLVSSELRGAAVVSFATGARTPPLRVAAFPNGGGR